MFTGLVNALGEVAEILHSETSARIRISAPSLVGAMLHGDSVSVNGACLTVVELDADAFSVDVMAQTLNLTSTGSLKIGSPVNLELATRASDRLGGHLVQGHVDGVGKILNITPGDQWVRMEVEVPDHLMKYVVAQGSICLEGVSLTVGDLSDDRDTVVVWLIPETLAKTNLSLKIIGDLVNIEVDVLAKYVERLLNRRGETQ